MNPYATGPTFFYDRKPFQLENLPVRIGALPTKLFQDAVNEFAIARRCSAELGYIGALSAIAIAIQNLFDVETPNGHRFPTAMMLVGVGGPTSGKSAAGNYFMKCIEDYEVSNSHLFPEAGFIYKNTTGPALFDGLDQFAMGGLVSYEGNEILNKIVRTEASNLNALWSGETIKIRRKTSKSFKISNARLSMLALVHPGRLQTLLSEVGEELRDVGLLARLVAMEASNIHIPPPEEPIPEPCREAFSSRIQVLLEKSTCAALDPQSKREVMRFNPHASRIWFDYSAQRKLDGLIGGQYELAPEHAGRLAQNVARVAALLHIFEGLEGDINESSLYAAIALCENASRHYMRLFVPQISEELDADFLDEWITRYKREKTPRPQRYEHRITLRRGGPNRMRDNEIIKPLIEILIARGRVGKNKINGTWLLDYMPWLPSERTTKGQSSV